MLNSAFHPVNRERNRPLFPRGRELSLREYAKRFPLLEHLSWSHETELEHHLSGSAIPMPPQEIFDPHEAPFLLVALGGGERRLCELVAARYGVPFERVLLCHGLSEGLFLVASAVIEAGDFAPGGEAGDPFVARAPRASGGALAAVPSGPPASLRRAH